MTSPDPDNFTLGNIDLFKAAESAPEAVVARGKIYYRKRLARIEDYDGQEATALVQGTQAEPYVVKIALDQHSRGKSVLVSCTCPHAQNSPGQFCKHHIAGLLELAHFLRTQPGRTDWRTTLNTALAQRPPRLKDTFHRLVFVLNGYPGVWDVEAQSIDLRALGVDSDATAGQVREVICGTQGVSLAPVASASTGASMARNPEEATAVRLIADRRRSQHDATTVLPTVLPLLKESVVTLRPNGSDKLEVVTVLEQTGRPELELLTDDGAYLLRPQIRLNDGVVNVGEGEAALICNRPAWVFAQGQLLQVEDSSGLLSWLVSAVPMRIPENDLPELMSSFVMPLSVRLPVVSDLLEVREEIDENPTPRLYLLEADGELVIHLRFGYGAAEAVFSSDYPETTHWYDAGRRGLVKILRKPETEVLWHTAALEHGLKKGKERNTLQLRQSITPAEFLLLKSPKLLGLGFEIFGEESLKSVRVNRSAPRISLGISSGIDWFDVRAEVVFGDTSATLRDLRRAIRKGQSYIKLADGSMGHIPDDWLRRYRRILVLAEETEHGLRLTRTQAALLEGIIEESDQTTLDEEFIRNRKELVRLQALEAQPLPSGLRVELRPYQRHGYDWLRFLYDHRFGGCLADDMGVGKTVQALALLQWLKENSSEQGASLVVAPKSVIENWHREAARFAPDLSVHMHTEMNRTRDVSLFDDFDLIITTYGLMRRDIAMLAKYAFKVIILDESQAIKNPGADTARAARSLHASCRLALTGTPVENNTLELWSQFAFLNPGMLGSVEAFRSEFANQIEKGEDQQIVEELRALVQPFILRRTKEEVAPELPERTESVVYCEMEAPQRKLYDQTKASYRAQLLGLIQQQGIDKSRMRILEGLLRLRQICNHPQLVDKEYDGPSTKMEALMEILSTVTSEGHKALVFSQFTRMLSVVKRELDRRRTPYAYLDGRTKNRQEVVDQFQEDPSVPLFLISLKAGGLGLNLTAADYVIHIDPWWNPAVESQASDRTHRIGQTRPVFIQKLIAQDSVEEKMLELQQRKRELVEKLISSEASFFKSLSADDVSELFG
ncbi:MAG: SNF2 helicase associated domain-containing protein [Armatimonadetes bacterium]|nr:SNF2 helicase associated domain-containing protein [Armatimonadota bacterium]